jgi:hypothetical protein
MNLSYYLKSRIAKKKELLKNSRYKRKYQKVCPEFVQEFIKDLEDGWSIGYACKTIPNELRAVKKAFSQYPELKKAYDDYLMSKTLKKFYKYPKL